MYLRIAARYGLAALGCVAFNLIYAQFSHGVSSAFMTYMFALPLVLGCIPALVSGALRLPRVPLAARQSWALAVSCLTVGSCLHGVFDIAGTASSLLIAYPLAAAAFALAAIAFARRG